MGTNNYWFGKHHPVEASQKVSKTLKGHKGYWENKHLSDGHKEKIRQATKGESNPFYGKHHTNETKIKISKANGGKPIICLETNKIYNTLSEASRETKINCSHICSCCKEKRKTAGGYHWGYVELKEEKDNLCR